MVKVLPQGKEDFGSSFGRAFGQGLGSTFPQLAQQLISAKELEKENEALKRMGVDLSGVKNPEVRKQALASILQGQQKENLLKQKMGFFENLTRGREQQGIPEEFLESEQIDVDDSPRSSRQSLNDSSFADISEEDIARATLVDPSMGNALRQMKSDAMNRVLSERKEENKKFESERSYQTQFSKTAEEQANKLREAIPKKQMALSFARDAVESGDLSFLSPDKLADITGIDAFRSAKGAQLITAGKENLLSNMSRVSARGQNMWFEKRLSSMFPKIGQSPEANLIVQEMLEGELSLDKAYLEEFDRLAEQDQQQYGFVKKDISKRAQAAVKPREKEIMKRTSYRLKELEEREKGIEKLRKQVGKKVVKGTPLTAQMAILYKEKFGDKAHDVAKKAGYDIPTFEEFQIYQKRPDEYMESEEEL